MNSLPGARRAERLVDGYAWEFDAALRDELERLLVLERRCCADVDWRLTTTETGGIRIEVRGIQLGAHALPGA